MGNPNATDFIDWLSDLNAENLKAGRKTIRLSDLQGLLASTRQHILAGQGTGKR